MKFQRPNTMISVAFSGFWCFKVKDFSQISHHQWGSLYTKLQPSNLAPDKVETTSQQYPNHIPWPPPSATQRRHLGRWQAASAATSAQPPEVGRLSELKLGVLHEHQYLHQNCMYSPSVCVAYQVTLYDICVYVKHCNTDIIWYYSNVTKIIRWFNYG